MGQLDQFAKQLFAEETLEVTHGACAWVAPPEIGMSEVRLDGLLQVRDAAVLAALAPPWSRAHGHREVVIEIRMQGDHLDFVPIERTVLRRHARQVQLAENPDDPFRDQVPLWVVAPHRPDALDRGRDVRPVAPGCYIVGPAWYEFLWIAANELPLRDELIPFLVARSGRALDGFILWAQHRRPPRWLWRMVQVLPMSISLRDEIRRDFLQNDDPEVRARMLMFAEAIVGGTPEVSGPLIQKGVEQGIEKGIAPLVHLCERKLGRPLADAETRALHERLDALGPDRLGDVVLDFDANALAAWLSDPNAR